MFVDTHSNHKQLIDNSLLISYQINNIYKHIYSKKNKKQNKQNKLWPKNVKRAKLKSNLKLFQELMTFSEWFSLKLLKLETINAFWQDLWVVSQKLSVNWVCGGFGIRKMCLCCDAYISGFDRFKSL